MKISKAVSILAVCAMLTGCSIEIKTDTTTSKEESTVSSTSTSSTQSVADTSSEVESSTSDTQSENTASVDFNKAVASLGSITEKDGNKQYSVTYTVENVTVYTETVVFDSYDKFVGGIREIELLSNITIDDVLKSMSMEDEKVNFKKQSDTKFATDITTNGYNVEAPMYSNGIQYAYDTQKELVDLANAMRENGMTGDFEYSGSIDFSDAEVTVIGEDTDEADDTSSSTVVEEEYTGSTVSFESKYTVNESGIIDLESYTLRVKCGEEAEAPINSIPAGKVTCSLNNDCASLIYSNGTLKVKGLTQGTSTLSIEVSNGKVGNVMIMVEQ